MPCQAILLLRLFFTFAPCPSAILCASNHKTMSKCSPPHVRRAFTLIELLVVIATVSILAAIAVPAFNSVLERAKATSDLSNLRQIAVLTQTYLNDKDGILPVMSALPGIGQTAAPVIYPKYVAIRKIFQSPFDKRTPLE